MTPARALAGFFAFACIAFWIFAFSPWARDIFTAPDQLEDETYVAALDSLCAEAQARVEALPSARSAATPADRIAAVTAGTEILDRLVEDMAALAGGTADDRRLVGLWLEDWEIYLDDRSRHAERLLTEGDVRFLNTEDNGVFVAQRMDGFSRVNELDACVLPGDI